MKYEVMDIVEIYSDHKNVGASSLLRIYEILLPFERQNLLLSTVIVVKVSLLCRIIYGFNWPRETVR